MVPLLFVPGGPELTISVLIVVIFVGIVGLAARLAARFTDQPESEDIHKRVALLEHEVEELQAQVADLEATDEEPQRDHKRK